MSSPAFLPATNRCRLLACTPPRSTCSRTRLAQPGFDSRSCSEHERVRSSLRREGDRRRQAVLRGPAGERERGPTYGVGWIRQTDEALAESEVADARRGSDALQRWAEDKIDAVRGLLEVGDVALTRGESLFVFLVGHGEAALDLRAHVGAVEVRMLGEQVPVDESRLPHEHRIGLLLEKRQVEAARLGEECGDRLHTLADERLGPPEPGDPDGELAKLDRRGYEPWNQRLHHRDAPRNVARHGSSGVEARREREATCERDQSVGGLEADDSAAGRGDADRARAVGPE